MQWFTRMSFEWADINCERKDGLMDRGMENRMPISHLAKAGVTKMSIKTN